MSSILTNKEMSKFSRWNKAENFLCIPWAILWSPHKLLSSVQCCQVSSEQCRVPVGWNVTCWEIDFILLCVVNKAFLLLAWACSMPFNCCQSTTCSDSCLPMLMQYAMSSEFPHFMEILTSKKKRIASLNMLFSLIKSISSLICVQ